MGADYKGQERAIEELSALSREAKMYLCHHIGNSLQGILGHIKLGRHEDIEQIVWHIVEDLELAGIREKDFRR